MGLDEMIVTHSMQSYADSIMPQDEKMASGHAIAHLAKRQAGGSEELRGSMNIVHCLSDGTLANMDTQLSFLQELVQNELSRRAR